MAICALFFTNGLLIGSLVLRFPEIKDAFGLSASVYGVTIALSSLGGNLCGSLCSEGCSPLNLANCGLDSDNWDRSCGTDNRPERDFASLSFLWFSSLSCVVSASCLRFLLERLQ